MNFLDILDPLRLLRGIGKKCGAQVTANTIRLRPPGNLCKEVESEGSRSPGWRPQALKVPGATRNRAPVCAR